VRQFDYEEFVGLKMCSTSVPATIPEDKNIKWKDFMTIFNAPDFKEKAVLVDVRPKEQFDVVKLPNAVSLPLGVMTQLSKDKLVEYDITPEKQVYVMCKRGIASKSATKHLLGLGFNGVYNIEGGITSYSKDIDPSTPVV